MTNNTAHFLDLPRLYRSGRNSRISWCVFKTYSRLAGKACAVTMRQIIAQRHGIPNATSTQTIYEAERELRRRLTRADITAKTINVEYADDGSGTL